MHALTLPLPIAQRPVQAPATESLVLPHRRLWSMAQPRGRTLHCARGTLWVTFDGCTRDFVLEAGESLHCRHDSRVIVQALGESRLTVV